MYVGFFKKVIELRGKDEALKIDPVDKKETKIKIADIDDADITPENGYYIFSEKKGKVQKVKPKNDVIDTLVVFKEDDSGQIWAVIKESWNGIYIFNESQYTELERETMGAIGIDFSTKYCVTDFEYDLSYLVNLFVWNKLQDLEPTWKQETD